MSLIEEKTLADHDINVRSIRQELQLLEEQLKTRGLKDSDRIECAIRHIESSLCVDPWAAEIAVESMRKQIPKKVRITTSTKRCSVCGRQLSGIGNIHPKRNYCQSCGQAIDWECESC